MNKWVISSFSSVAFWAKGKRWVGSPNEAIHYGARDEAVIASWSVSGKTEVVSLEGAEELLIGETQP